MGREVVHVPSYGQGHNSTPCGVPFNPIGRKIEVGVLIFKAISCALRIAKALIETYSY